MQLSSEAVEARIHSTLPVVYRILSDLIKDIGEALALELALSEHPQNVFDFNPWSVGDED